MTDLWLFPHRAELECAQMLWKKQNSSFPLPHCECIGFGQKSVRHWLAKFRAEVLASQEAFEAESLQSTDSETRSSFDVHVSLLGIAGALDPKLQVGDVIEQRSGENLFLFLSETPLENPDEARRLFIEKKRKAVVMESFWSDPEILPQLKELEGMGICFSERRGISDHCQGLPLSEIRKRLPNALEKAIPQNSR